MTVYIPDLAWPSRRLKTLRIAPCVLLSLLESLCRSPRCFSAVGLPTDARLVSTRYDAERDEVILSIESAEFPEVADGHISSDVRLSLTEHHVDKEQS